MATDTQTPWTEKTNGHTHPASNGKRRRQRGKRRWPPKVAGETPLDFVGPPTRPEGLLPPAIVPGLAQRAEEAGLAEGVDSDELARQLAEASGEDQALIDPELIRVLQSLSATIDTAHHVLYAAAEATQRHVEAYDEAAPGPQAAAAPAEQTAQIRIAAAETTEQTAISPSHKGPAQIAPGRATTHGQVARGQTANGSRAGVRRIPPVPPAPPEPAPPPSSSRGLKIATAATALTVVATVAWTIHANPWLLSDVTEAIGASNGGSTAANASQRNVSMMRVAEVPKPNLATIPAAVAPTAQPKAPASEKTMSASLSPSTAPLPPVAAPEPLTPRRVTVQPVHGPAGQPIALRLEVPEISGNAELSAMVQGVPEQAKLSAGRRIAGGTWIVDAQQIESLSLIAPADLAGREVPLEITLVKSDGKIPEELLLTVNIEAAPPSAPQAPVAAAPNGPSPAAAPAPVSAPAAAPSQGIAVATPAPTPEPQPALKPLSKEAEQRVLERGQELLQQRDFAAARLMFEHAARRGSKPAMLALAKTYDPQFLARLGIKGVKGDKDQADAWYERAAREADR